MAFFNDLGKKIQSATGAASEMAKDVTEKAKDSVEINKLNSAISAEQRLVQQYYVEIGEAFYVTEKDNPNSPVAAVCAKINASLSQIQDLQDKIADIKTKPETPADPSGMASSGRSFCSECGAAHELGQQFCVNCGSKF